MTEPLLERRFLEQLERLTLHWQKSFSGLVGGHNVSQFSGSGQEFLDHRTFHSGDDLRAVNWRAYMRFEKLFLKMFQVEPRVPVRLLLDVSASMLSGGEVEGNTKFDYVRRLAAALVYVGLVRLDSMLLQPFSDGLHDPFLVSGGRHRFQPAEQFLRRLQGRGRTNYLNMARKYLGEYPQRGLTIILSDFLGDSECSRALQYISDFGHELLLVQVWTEEDREPLGEGEIELIEAESEAHMRILLNSEARAAYTESFDAYADEIRKLALRNGGRYVGLPIRVALSDAMFGQLNLGNARTVSKTGASSS